MTSAFESYQLGSLTLRNRIVMAPMTRRRAQNEGRTATDLMATYYAQRASAGLIITEGIQPSVVGQGYTNTPGLHSQEQVESWRQVTDAVHANGGRIFAQLMHVGRLSHPEVTANGQGPVGVSAVAADGQVHIASGHVPFPVPTELDEGGIQQTIADFASAARNAIDAGFDGVELHGANGYLIHQFLADNTNLRTDRWGGSPENRTRFAVEVAKAVVAEVGAERVGIRISPANRLNDIAESNLAEVYTLLVKQLTELNLVYLHILEVPGIRDLVVSIRELWPNTLILNPATHPRPTSAEELELIESGLADLVAFGALFISNPDLPERLAVGGPFAMPDFSKAYGGDAAGYTDYDTMDAA